MSKPLDLRHELAFLDGLQDPDQAFMDRHGDTSWFVNDTPLSEYIRNAAIEPSFLDLIKERVVSAGNRTGLEIAAGSNGVALQDLLGRKVLSRALMVNYEDTRSHVVEGLDQITGDIVNASTWERMFGWQREFAPSGFSLIMHRPARALQELPAEVYAGASGVLLNMLAPGGVLFTQIPSSLSSSKAGKLSLQEMHDAAIARGDIENITVLSNPTLATGPVTALGYAVVLKATEAKPVLH